MVGDVTDKGVPAAMVMATTHSILRSDAPRLVDPGVVLSRANELLCAEMPPNMFVTCLYAVLDPATGHLRLRQRRPQPPVHPPPSGVVEPRATGMPLGLMSGMTYEEQEVMVEPASVVLLYSDGLVEAHNRAGELYGFPRLAGPHGPHPARWRRGRRGAVRPGGVHRPGVGAGGRHHARVDRTGGRAHL